MTLADDQESDDYPSIRRFQSDATTAFLRAARSGNLEKVVEYLDEGLDINTANNNGLNALHLASKDGHLEIVNELLKRGATVDAATKKGNTALHIASLAGQSEVVNVLIQYGAAVNIQSQNGFTPLYMAAQENHDQVVKILLANGANQSLATEDGFTPLAVAMQQGHDKVVSVLLENDSKGKVRLPALHIAAKKDDCKAADLLLQNDHKPDVTSKSGFTPLHIAAHYGNEDIARLLIKRGADVNFLAKHNISPLHVAAKWGKNNMVKILLESGAAIDAKTRDGLTPLHCAARSGHEECVTSLLEASAPISARTKNGLAPLHMASQGDHVDAARVLLYHRAPVDEVTIDYLTSLHVAAHCGHVRVAKLLLDRKADPNARALNGFTPLHIACKKNRIKVVELLLKHGASIESTTESGLTPLHVASFMGCMNIVIFLLQHEANPDVPTVRGESPLHLAARANQTDIIRILLRNGAKVDARAREQQTPLHIASRLGNVDIVMLLLQHGAAIDTTTKDMYTALHIAAKEGQEEVAAILVDNNASVRATTKNGFTPLHIAAKYGNMNVAKILLQKDSNIDAQGKNDITPLLLACHYDHSNVAQLLLEKGASPHLASQNGQTPLHIAARKNQMDIATTLLEHGAKADVESKAGFTPLHLSAQKGHYDMTNLLIEHGADQNHKAKNGLTALHLCAQEDFIRVASILVKNGANVESETETGYRPIHVAAHFGNLSMIRFLLKHGAEIDVTTKQNYTPLHQAAQQGHAHIVGALVEGSASHRARTNDGLTALNIAQKLGYISVMEVLKGLPYDGVTPDNKNWEEKYKVIAPESLQETSLMSDSDDEGGSDALISEQPYRYLTADLMKSLRDDSLPIDVTRDDPVHKQFSKEEQQQFVQSSNYCAAENFDSNEFSRPSFKSFLVSFLVDARGGTMKGCRHSGIRLIVPPRRATMPIRVTCKLVKPSKMAIPPPLMEGESLATRVIEMGPVGASFLGPVLIDIPHFASVEGKEREIIILRSENGETWKEHDNSADNDDTLLNTPYDLQMSSSHSGRITRIITPDFPQYFAIVTRIKQEVHVIGAEGGILISSVANNVQAVFPPGALTKKIKVGLQAHVIPAELTAKLLGNCVAVSPVITIEPRRRKFHKPIQLTLPVPQAANKGMINHYGGETPTLRLLCSIAGGTSEAQWEDVTGSTPLNFMNDRVTFTTTVSARFWLMDCRNIQEVPKMATELYRESLFVPFITNFVIFSKRVEEIEATLRILCMTDSKEGVPTLEKQEEFAEIVKSRDVETLDGKDIYLEFTGNLVPVTKSGQQLKFTFKAFRQNRLSFHVKVKDPQLDPVARMMFMREQKVAKGEPSQQPLCVLNIVLPEIAYVDKNKSIEDSNILSQKMDLLRKSYRMDYDEEKGDEPKRTSPSEKKKFIAESLRRVQTDAIDSLLAQQDQSTTPLDSVEASLSPQDIVSPALEKKTYTEKRRFWEDMTKSKRESFQRSESEVSHASQLTYHDSDSECLSEVREKSEEEAVPECANAEATVDRSEASVAEKADYFEKQIQKEKTAARTSFISQSSQDSSKIARWSGISTSSEDDKSLKVFEETERMIEERMKQETDVDRKTDKVEPKKIEGNKGEIKEKKEDAREKRDEVKKLDEAKDKKSEVKETAVETLQSKETAKLKKEDSKEKQDVKKEDVKLKKEDSKEKKDATKLKKDDSTEKRDEVKEKKDEVKVKKEDNKDKKDETKEKTEAVEERKEETKKKGLFGFRFGLKSKDKEDKEKAKDEKDDKKKSKEEKHKKGFFGWKQESKEDKTEVKSISAQEKKDNQKERIEQRVEEKKDSEKVVTTKIEQKTEEKKDSEKEMSVKVERKVEEKKDEEKEVNSKVEQKLEEKKDIEKEVSTKANEKLQEKKESENEATTLIQEKVEDKKVVEKEISSKLEQRVEEVKEKKEQASTKVEEEVMKISIESKIQSDMITTETIAKIDDITVARVDLPDIEKLDKAVMKDTENKTDADKESKPKATKMQENVTKQQRDAESRSPVTSPKSAKANEELSSKQPSVKQKSKEESSPKAIPPRQKSKEDPLSKSPPKKDKPKADVLSKSPPKRDKPKEISPAKTDKTKEATPGKAQTKTDTAQDANVEKPTPKKDEPTEISKSPTPKVEKAKDELPSKSPKVERPKTGPPSPPKSSKAKDASQATTSVKIDVTAQQTNAKSLAGGDKQMSLDIKHEKISDMKKESVEGKKDAASKAAPGKPEKPKRESPTKSPPKEKKIMDKPEERGKDIPSIAKKESVAKSPPKEKKLMDKPEERGKDIPSIAKKESVAKSPPKEKKPAVKPESEKAKDIQISAKRESIAKSPPKDRKSAEKLESEKGKDVPVIMAKKESPPKSPPKDKKLNEKSESEKGKDSSTTAKKESAPKSPPKDKKPTDKPEADKQKDTSVATRKDSAVKSPPKDRKPIEKFEADKPKDAPSKKESPPKEKKPDSSRPRDIPSAAKKDMPAKSPSPKDGKPIGKAISDKPKEKSLVTKKESPIKSPSPPKDKNAIAKPEEDVPKDMSSYTPKRERSLDKIPESLIPVRQKSKDEFLVKSLLKGDESKDASVESPKREKSSGEIPKSMIPVREKSKEEMVIKPKDDKPKAEAALVPEPKSTALVREKSKEEIALTKMPTDLPLIPGPQRERSLDKIPESMIPVRQKSKDEFFVKSPPLPLSPKREKSNPDIPKSMIPVREKSKEEFLVKLPSKDVKANNVSSVDPQKEKSTGSTVPAKQTTKEEFSMKSSGPSTTTTKRESIGEIPKSMIPVREKSKEEFSVKSPPTVTPQREKSFGEIPKSMIPVREKSKEEFSVKSPPTVTPQREKSFGEIPKSMIPVREKSKEEFSVKSPPMVTPQREKSFGEIPKSMIPVREKSKEEFSIKSPPTVTPQREKSFGEIPKSMIPRREKSKDEFSVKSPSREGITSPPKREKSSSEIPKSMIPVREKSKEEFSIKSPPTITPQREKSFGEIPKSMIPRREKSKDEFSVKSPPREGITSPPKREKSSSEIPKSMIPVREKSKDEIPKSMLPKREKSKDTFGIKSPPKVSPTPVTKRENSSGEIPKSMIPKREKSKDEFSARSSPPKDDKSKSSSSSSSSGPKREKSVGELPKSMIPKREKSKEEFSLKSPPKRETVPASLSKREKSKEEASKSAVPKREKSKEEFTSRVAPSRQKSKEDIAKPGPKRQDSKGESSAKSGVKKADSLGKISPDKKEEGPSTKTGAVRRGSKEESPRSGIKKADSASKVAPKREKSKEEIAKSSATKRRDSRESPFPPDPTKFLSKRPSSSISRDSTSSSVKSDSRSSSVKSESPSPKSSMKLSRKETTPRKESESMTISKKERSERVTTEEEHTRKETSESQIFSGTFTGDPQEALKLLEDTSALKQADFVMLDNVLTSKVDHKATTSSEKTEVKSSEIDTGVGKFVSHEEKKDLQRKETTDSLLTRHSPEKRVEERESKIKDTSVSGVQRTLLSQTGSLQTILASDSEIGKQVEHDIKIKSVEDSERILTTQEKTSSLRGTAAGAQVKIEKDLRDAKKDDLGKIVEKSTFQEQVKDSSKTVDVKEQIKSELEASKCDSGVGTGKSPDTGTIESEIYHDELADDLTRKFENILKKSDEREVEKLASLIQEETADAGSARNSASISISEDITKDESSSLHLSSSCVDQGLGKSEDVKQADIKLETKTVDGKFVSELSGARVLEICEPEESQSRQDSMDVSSIEIDEVKFSGHEFHPKEGILHESPAVDSLKALDSTATLSEETNIDYSLPQDSQKKSETLQKITIERKVKKDSFELDSPPLVSPRLKVKELEIKPVDWILGDEKVEVKESLEPSQAFDRELEEYQKRQTQGMKFEIPRIEETKSTSFDESESSASKPKFTVIPVSEQDLEIEKELVENKLDISCQELMDTLQREYDAKTPTDDRLEEMAARSFHFMTIDDDEDSFDYDKERYEAEQRKRSSGTEEGFKLDMPLATKTAVNVIEGEQFMSLDDPLKSNAARKTEEGEMLQLFEEKLEETVAIKDKPAEITKKTVEVEGTHESLPGKAESEEPKKEEKESLIPEKVEGIKSINEVKTGSYDVKDFVQHPETSEMLLKTEAPKPESDLKKDDAQLLSYKTFDPEDAKRQEETRAPSTVQKPPRSEFHRETKMDLRTKGWDDHRRMSDKREKSHASHTETSPYKVKKEDLQNVDMSSKYAITVLDQVVKKEIAEVKENLEAAKQDLIEELSENSENVIQIEDSPSEFQFKLQPESIPNELPFLYKPPSLDKISDAENLSSSSSPIAKPRKHEESSSESSSDKKPVDATKTSIVGESESEKMSQKKSDDTVESIRSSSPKATNRSSGSDVEAGKDDSFSLQPPQPAPRRRPRGRSGQPHVTSESEADVSSSTESTYQSCERSRPSSSDVDAFLSAAQASSTTVSEYETAMMSFEHSSRGTSQDYFTAASTLSSKDMSSVSSGQFGSLDTASELSETIMASEGDLEKDEIDENLENILEDDEKLEEGSKAYEIGPDVPCLMKRSSEMIFTEVITKESVSDGVSSGAKQTDSSSVSSSKEKPSTSSVATTSSDSASFASAKSGETLLPTAVVPKQSSITEDLSSSLSETKAESYSFEPDSLEVSKHIAQSTSLEADGDDIQGPSAGLTWQQQQSMTSSSMSGVSLETVIEKADRQSPDSDSFELVEKPDLIDDFVVVEEVGREAEEFDSEGKGVRITSSSFKSSKMYDRDVENLLAEKEQQEAQAQKAQAHSARSTVELFDFDSEESPPQASNEDQYSQSYSDEEQYSEGGKKWIEMQFQQNDARLYDLEYERAPLEDIKEEEVADFEAGSSRFGSVGSQKESIGSFGSMRGSFGSTPDNYEALTAKRYFKPTDHDNVSLSSLQEFEHLEIIVAQENEKRKQREQREQHSSSQDSSSNGSLPRRYQHSRSGPGDDVSISSVKDFEVLEKACKEAHLIELRAREEEDLLDHESPENRYKLENLARAKVESQESAAGSFNPSTSGSDDYEKRIKEIDEIIRLAQANVEKIERQDDGTEDVARSDSVGKVAAPVTVVASGSPMTATLAASSFTSVIPEPARPSAEVNPMETSTDSLELEGNGAQNYNLMCRSSDSLELRTAIVHPSVSSDSLNNVRDMREEQDRQFSSSRRISSDSLEFSAQESLDGSRDGRRKDSKSEG